MNWHHRKADARQQYGRHKQSEGAYVTALWNVTASVRSAQWGMCLSSWPSFLCPSFKAIFWWGMWEGWEHTEQMMGAPFFKTKAEQKQPEGLVKEKCIVVIILCFVFDLCLVMYFVHLMAVRLNDRKWRRVLELLLVLCLFVWCWKIVTAMHFMIGTDLETKEFGSKMKLQTRNQENGRRA